ncbi:DUF29 domain-containing protein [Pseudanabaena sp. ABRG5-3]|uniref:DUF29 domain-containing protein n=1 Tax=Pseudanabaena sp. ABRG5-3 TaxID=685565 RepID=UPI000DC707F5|nr:DUF29 domain-containing protein [Pseudanabaena sp. ABRG5-3]BBC26001.1 hypothetical protein ABRG53_3744 [Pseudanabaena sp. ABRG5-3]
MTAKLYDTDFYAWTLEQSQLLQSGDWKSVDIVHLVEEIESLGKQEKRELENRLGVLIGHLLKWIYQPSMRSRSWQVTIRVQRQQLQRHIQQNPSLKSYLSEAIAVGYDLGLELFFKETQLIDQDLPEVCPFTEEQIFNPTFPEV